MNNLTSNLRNKMELWGYIKSTDGLEDTITQGKIKEIFVYIVPATLSTASNNNKSTDAGTEYTQTTHKIKCRKLSIKDLKINMWFKDSDGLRYDILYFQQDYKNKEYWEIMVKAKYE